MYAFPDPFVFFCAEILTGKGCRAAFETVSDDVHEFIIAVCRKRSRDKSRTGCIYGAL